MALLASRNLVYVLGVSIFFNFILFADRWLTPQDDDDDIDSPVRSSSAAPMRKASPLDQSSQQCVQAFGKTQCADFYPGYHENRLTHIIIPFHTSQASRVEANLKAWSEYLPCTAEGGKGASPNGPFHLVLYSSADSRKRQQLLELEARLHWMVGNLTAEAMGCFASYEIQHANLSGPSDTYYRGTRLMMERLILNKVKLQHTPQYAFYMEPDCLPVRPNWLNALDTSVRWPAAVFWMRGSIYRGNNKGVYATRHPPQVFHINGNALFNLADRRFRTFYVKHFRPYVNAVSKTRERSFDTEFYRFLHDIDNIMVTRAVIHRFQYSEFVQNFWRSSYSLAKIKNDFPDTYFIHGGYQKP
jgi:hypothetical protein